MVDTIAADQSTLESIFENQVFTGTIDTAGDVDWVKITVSSGVHTFNLVGDPYFGHAISDPLLKLYNSSGSLLAQDDDNGYGSNPYFQYTFSQPGTYYVAISGYYVSTPSTYTGDYWFSVTNGEIPGNTSTAANIRVGIPMAGILDPGLPDTFHPGGAPDRDYYRITLKAGVTYTITVEPDPGVNGPISHAIEAPLYVAVYLTDAGDTNSYGYDESDDEDGPATFQFTPSTTGTYYVVATAPDSFTGNYTLNVSGALDINHRPSGSNKTITIAEDTPYTFSMADMGYSDADGNPLYAARIMSLPSVGTLTDGSAPVHVGDIVYPTNLKWTPPADFNGTASFTFQVRDSVSSTTEQGTDPDPKTIILNVTPVDDAPVITSNGGGDSASVGIAENNTAVTTVQAFDVDSAVSYFISGTDAALFNMGADGVLSFKTAPDFEVPKDANGDKVYDVTVLASSGALSDTQLLHIAVQNVGGATITGGKKGETVDAKHKMGGQFATNEEDTINGKGGSDKINGLRGNDTLTGGKDDDKFVFSTKLGAGNIETITDFTHDHDKLLLDDKIFRAIGSSLSSDEFYAHSKAHAGHDKSDRIVYDTKHGKLFYDDDGKGGHAAVQIAVLTHHPTLDAGDFAIV